MKHRSYIPDTNGNAWKWNCGWKLIDKSGDQRRDMRALGHLEFRRIVTPVTPEDINERIGPRNRPNGLWRRVLDMPYEHAHTGAIGKIIATDGVHAIFRHRNADGDFVKTEVHFRNLNEAKPDTRMPSKTKAEHKKNESQLKKKYVTVSLSNEDINSLLA